MAPSASRVTLKRKLWASISPDFIRLRTLPQESQNNYWRQLLPAAELSTKGGGCGKMEHGFGRILLLRLFEAKKANSSAFRKSPVTSPTASGPKKNGAVARLTWPKRRG